MNNQVVECYFNLHKKLFSIRDKRTGLVIGHAPTVFLKDCTFKVSKAGRARVLREKKKNVHAFVVGTPIDLSDTISLDYAFPIGYNPYLGDSFIRKDNGEKVCSAKFVVLSQKGGIACF